MSEKTILLVEDNQDDEELAVLAFERSRIANDMVVVRDGQEALDYFFGTEANGGRDRKELPQMVLLDLKLPKVDGLEVLKDIRSTPNMKPIPVVMLTSSAEERDVLESYRLGANSYIVKPVDTVDFDKVISDTGLYWMLVNKVPS